MATSPLSPVVQGPPPNDPLPGMQLGEYIIEKAVAAGGMGIVYLARHSLLGRSVAVKVLRPEYARNEEQTARFLKEARAIAGIRHKGIVTVENFGKLPDGRQYMLMEFLEGETLEQLLLRDAPLHPNRALPLLDEVLDALSAAHKVNVVHRDLKPSNIFLVLQSNGARYCKLVDFGLAQQSMFNADLAQPFAKASLVAGTPEYVSPEQARGLVATARTDLYCCGVILYEMLTGRLPVAAPTLTELLQKQVYQRAPRVSDTTPVIGSLDDLVASMLEKDPEARPRSADVVRQAIARVLKEMKEASTQYVARPSPLMRAAMAEPVLEDTQVSGSNQSVEPPPEPRSDGRGKRSPAADQTQLQKQLEPITPKVDAQMERTLDGQSSGDTLPAAAGTTGGLSQHTATQRAGAGANRRPTGRMLGLFVGLGAAVMVFAVLIVARTAPQALVQPLPIAQPPPAGIEPPKAGPRQTAATPEAPLVKPPPASRAAEPRSSAQPGLDGRAVDDAPEKKPAHKVLAVPKKGPPRDSRPEPTPVAKAEPDPVIRPLCNTDWKATGVKEVQRVEAAHLQGLDPKKETDSARINEVSKRAADLKAEIGSAKTPADCEKTLTRIGAWVFER